MDSKDPTHCAEHRQAYMEMPVVPREEHNLVLELSRVTVNERDAALKRAHELALENQQLRDQVAALRTCMKLLLENP